MAAFLLLDCERKKRKRRKPASEQTPHQLRSQCAMSARTIDDCANRTLAELWQSCDQNAIEFMNLINEFIGRRAGHVERSPAPVKFEREQEKEKKIDAWRDHSCASSFVLEEERDDDDNKSNLNCSIDSGSQAAKGNGLNDRTGRDREDSGRTGERFNSAASSLIGSPNGSSTGRRRIYQKPSELAAPDDEDKLNSYSFKINKSDAARSESANITMLNGIVSEKQKCMNSTSSFTSPISAPNSLIKRFEFCNHIKNEQENHKIELTADCWPVCSGTDCDEQKFIGLAAEEAKTREFGTKGAPKFNQNEQKNNNQLSDSCTPTHQSGNVFTRSDNFAGAGLPVIDRSIGQTALDKRSESKLNKVTKRTEDCHNGSNVYDFKSNELLYSWSQSLTDLDITVPLPNSLKSKRQCRVTIRSNALTVAFESGRVQDGDVSGNTKSWTNRLDGQLAFAIRTNTACWTLDLSGRRLRLFLEKQQERWWKCCLANGEPELDLNALERTIAYDQLTNDEQNVIRQLTYRARLSADSDKVDKQKNG